jgi:hypothetical protein
MAHLETRRLRSRVSQPVHVRDETRHRSRPETVILFFSEDLGEPNREFSRFDQMKTEQASYRSMRGDSDSCGKQYGSGCMENRIVGT